MEEKIYKHEKTTLWTLVILCIALLGLFLYYGFVPGYVFLAVLVLLIAALLVAWYLYQHEDDWLSSTQALRIAVHDAGTDEGRVYDVRTTYGTTENDLPVYEVLFTDHTAEYRYVIDAQTGRILDHTSTLTVPES